MRLPAWGVDSASGTLSALASSRLISSGSSSSRISAQMRTRSARAACALRSQNANVMPGDGTSAIAMPLRVASRPMMWRTTTSAPNWPVRRLPTSLNRSSGRVRPTRVRRTFANASRGWSSETPRSPSSTSSAGRPFNAVTTLPSQAVISYVFEMGWQPWVTRDIKDMPPAGSRANATPLKPPLKTPPAAPWPLTLPWPLSANCTVEDRLDASPPKT